MLRRFNDSLLSSSFYRALMTERIGVARVEFSFAFLKLSPASDFV